MYRLIFRTTLPRPTEEMKACLHNPNEPVGDWFPYKEYIVLRAYGYEEEPYKLPFFLTKRTFSLEFLRERLYVESEIFLEQ